MWRFTAAALVTLSHAYFRIVETFPAKAGDTVLFASEHLRTWGHLGVDFFFVISGFIMVWTNWEQFGASGASGRFLLRRIGRIVPLYWVATTLGVALLANSPSLFSYGQQLDLRWILSCYLFVPTISPSGDLFSPLLGLGWTLNYEMYFYAVFALALLLPRFFGVVALSLFFAGSAAIGALIPFASPLLIQNSSWLLVEFVLGAWVGVLMRSGRTISGEWARTLLAVSAVALALSLTVSPTNGGPAHRGPGGLHLTRFVWWGVPCAVLLYASLSLRHDWLRSRLGQFLVLLGNGSYSIYLFQVFALPGTAIAIRMIDLGRWLHVDVLIVVMFVCSIAFGWVVYQTIERPGADLLALRSKRRWRPRAPHVMADEAAAVGVPQRRPAGFFS